MKFKTGHSDGKDHWIGSLAGPEISREQFRKLQTIIGEPISNPIYDPPKEHAIENEDERYYSKSSTWPARPLKYLIVLEEGKLKCYWKGHITAKDDVVFSVTSPKRGYDSNEWDLVTRLAIVGISEASKAVRKFIFTKLGMNPQKG